jgi:hypothetical protein
VRKTQDCVTTLGATKDLPPRARSFGGGQEQTRRPVGGSYFRNASPRLRKQFIDPGIRNRMYHSLPRRARDIGRHP